MVKILQYAEQEGENCTIHAQRSIKDFAVIDLILLQVVEDLGRLEQEFEKSFVKLETCNFAYLAI